MTAFGASSRETSILLLWNTWGSLGILLGHFGCNLQVGFPDSSAGKESACNAGDLGSIPGLGRAPGEGKGYPLQYSGLENSMDCTDMTERLSLHFTSNYNTIQFVIG